MREVVRSALVSYTPAQMFALVEDIERYPQFLPGVTAAQVQSRGERWVQGTLTMERAGVRETFTTRNELAAPSRMVMRLVEGPFRTLEGEWTFSPIEEAGAVRGTRVGLRMRFEFRNPITALLLSKAFESTFASLVDAFTRRAKAVYG